MSPGLTPREALESELGYVLKSTLRDASKHHRRIRVDFELSKQRLLEEIIAGECRCVGPVGAMDAYAIIRDDAVVWAYARGPEAPALLGALIGPRPFRRAERPRWLVRLKRESEAAA